jgi:hypothetical protein
VAGVLKGTEGFARAVRDLKFNLAFDAGAAVRALGRMNLALNQIALGLRSEQRMEFPDGISPADMFNGYGGSR